jgi:DNA invertase Pin-like site-specific DNA recombinase
MPKPHYGRYVAYHRVSTGPQGQSGRGLEAQRQTLAERLNGGNWKLVREFTEIEGATRRAKARPQLEAALAQCRVMGARLIVANVSQLRRDPDFMSKLVAADVEVEFCDMPRLEGPVGSSMLRQMLAVAELEAGMIGERTRKALAAAKARGKKLGGDRGNIREIGGLGRAASVKARRERARQRALDLVPTLANLMSSGATGLRQIAAGLNQHSAPAPRGGQWRATQVSRLFDLLERVNEKFPPDETSNSEEARKRRRSQIIGRVIGKTDTAEVETEETLRRVGLPMADVATWQIEAALRATGGVISKAAEKLRVSRVTLWRRIRREPHLRDVVFECRETLLDEAEGVLLAEIEKGNFKAAKYVLSQFGARRGYKAAGGNLLGPIEEEEELIDQRTQPVDLKRLTNEELEELERLLRKAAVEEPPVIW